MLSKRFRELVQLYAQNRGGPNPTGGRNDAAWVRIGTDVTAVCTVMTVDEVMMAGGLITDQMIRVHLYNGDGALLEAGNYVIRTSKVTGASTAWRLEGTSESFESALRHDEWKAKLVSKPPVAVIPAGTAGA